MGQQTAQAKKVYCRVNFMLNMLANQPLASVTFNLSHFKLYRCKLSVLCVPITNKSQTQMYRSIPNHETDRKMFETALNMFCLIRYVCLYILNWA